MCLPANPSQEQYMSKESVIAGWGYFDVTQESPETSKVLRDTEVRVQSHDTCLNTRGAYRWDGRKHVLRYGYFPSQYQPDINICTAGRTEVWHGPRPGDSGSALMMEENGRSSKIFSILLNKEKALVGAFSVIVKLCQRIVLIQQLYYCSFKYSDLLPSE